MKTEQEIAKENIREYKEFHRSEFIDGKFEEHLSTLRRWLDYLCCLYSGTDNEFSIESKVKEIKQAIKLYEDALGGNQE